jgi:hypothetical protein
MTQQQPIREPSTQRSVLCGVYSTLRARRAQGPATNTLAFRPIADATKPVRRRQSHALGEGGGTISQPSDNAN